MNGWLSHSTNADTSGKWLQVECKKILCSRSAYSHEKARREGLESSA